MRIRRGWMLAALVAAPALAQAQAQSCPSLSSIELPGGSWRIEQPLVQALHEVLTPHGWSLQLRGVPAGFVGPRISGQVAAPTLLQALQHATQAAHAAGWRVDLMADKGRCQAVLAFDAQQAAVGSSAASAAPAAAPTGGGSGSSAMMVSAAGRLIDERTPPQEPTEIRLEAGQPLSRALRSLLSANGWSMAWQLDYDYFLDAPLVFAPVDLKTILERVVSIYQQHGGLIGVRARFAADNKVVVFEEVDHAR